MSKSFVLWVLEPGQGLPHSYQYHRNRNELNKNVLSIFVSVVLIVLTSWEKNRFGKFKLKLVNVLKWKILLVLNWQKNRFGKISSFRKPKNYYGSGLKYSSTDRPCLVPKAVQFFRGGSFSGVCP